MVGSANFPENVLLAEIYAEALTAKGVKVSTKLNIGSRETYIPALKDGSIDLIPEYSGVLLQYFDKTATQTTSDDVFSALKTAVPAPLEVLDQSQAQDKDAVVVTGATASKYHLTSIGDLKAVRRQDDLRRPARAEDPADRPARAEVQVRRGVRQVPGAGRGWPADHPGAEERSDPGR